MRYTIIVVFGFGACTSAQMSGLCGSDYSVTIRWVGDCAAMATSSSSFAAAVCYGGGGMGCVPSEFDLDANFLGGNSHAVAGCGCGATPFSDCNGDGFINIIDWMLCGGAACAEAQTFWPPIAGDIVVVARFNSVGRANAKAEANIAIEPLQCAQMEITGTIPAQVPMNFDSGISRQVILCGDMAIGVLYGECGSIGQGVSFDSKLNEWQFTKEVSGVGDILGFSFADADFDLDSDGRFTQADVDELQDNLGSMNAPFVPRWDLNNNGEIDQSDIDTLQTLLDSGFGSGVFGDSDDDGDIDCLDRDAMVALQDTTLCDMGYILALDADLDGDIDGDDLNAMDAIPPSPKGDLDHDGDVDGADQAILLTRWNSDDPEADLNDDRVVNGSDMAILLTNWGATCD